MPARRDRHVSGPAFAFKCDTTEDTDTDGGHSVHLVHGKTTHLIMGCAYRVHSRLGPGLLERAYKVCLAHEFSKLKLLFQAEKALPVHYDDLKLDLGYRVDFIVEEHVIVEVKAVETVLPVHQAQLLSYLKLSGKRVGLLINFNVARLKDGIHRRICG